MATDNYQNTDILGFLADAAITSNLGVKLTAAYKVSECDTAGERSLGVALSTVTEDGDDVGVIPGPCFKRITSGAAFAVFAELAVDADGKYRTATAGQVVVAYAMQLAGAADETVVAFILPPSQYRVPSANIADAVAIAGGESPTEAEYNALVTKLNAVIAALEAHGITATS